MAALRGDLDEVRRYIAAGGDLNGRDTFGSTPLIIAITFGRTDVGKALIDAGADLKLRNKQGWTPLHIAALFGNKELVRALLDKGADRQLRDYDGATAFDFVQAPFEEDRSIYDSISKALGPLGLQLDYAQIRNARPEIAEMLRPRPADLKAVKYAPRPGGDIKVSTPGEQGLDAALLAELYFDAAAMPNLYGLLVIKNGYLIGERYFNGWEPERKAKLQSVTKSYTSSLVGIALEQGHLKSLDQKMIDFFPEFADEITDARKNQITIRHLLQMRAGYPWEESDPELFKILYAGFRPRYLVQFPLESDPGTQFAYSNLSSHLLSVILSRAIKTDLKTYAQTYLFSPISSELGAWTKDWAGNYLGHAEMHVSARDVAKFGLLYLNDGQYEGKQVVPSSWVNESLKMYSEKVNTAGLNLGKVGRYFRDVGYGYQWWSPRVGAYRFNLAWGHGGQLVVLLKAHNMVVTVISDPHVGQHNDRAWGEEQGNLNLVGKFIESLPKAQAPAESNGSQEEAS